MVNGGKDPVDYFRDHPGRFPALHVKDMAEDGSLEDVGAGKLDFAGMFAYAAQRWRRAVAGRARQARRLLGVGRAKLPRAVRSPVSEQMLNRVSVW